jgi:excisionase family DNA binding protein
MLKQARPKPQPKTERAAWPMREGCYRLGISRTSAYEMNKLGKLNFVKFGGRTLIPESEIKRLTTVNQRVAS